MNTPSQINFKNALSDMSFDKTTISFLYQDIDHHIFVLSYSGSGFENYMALSFLYVMVEQVDVYLF